MNKPSSSIPGTLRLGPFQFENLLVPVVDEAGNPLVYCSRAETNYLSRLTFDAHARDGELIARVKNSNIYPVDKVLYEVRMANGITQLLARANSHEILYLDHKSFTAVLGGKFYLSNGTSVLIPLGVPICTPVSKPLVANKPDLLARRQPSLAKTSRSFGRVGRERTVAQITEIRKPS
jgi:hypothetical protein